MQRTVLRSSLLLLAALSWFTLAAPTSAEIAPTREGSGLPALTSALPAPLAQTTPNLAATGRDGNWIPVPDLPVPAPDMSPRFGHTIVFDSVNQRFIAFGGNDGNGIRKNDVWTHAINGGAPWSVMPVVGPAPIARFQHSAIYDAAGQRMLVFGGDASAGLMGDLWQLDLAAATPTWSPVVTVGTPPSVRAAHTAVFDPVRRRMIVFGGRTPSLTNETWVLDCTTTPPTWQMAFTSIPLPLERSTHGAIFDTAHDRMVIYGGLGNVDDLGDVWTLSMSSFNWTQIQGSGGPGLPRIGACVGYDPSGNRMFVSSGDLWSLDLGSFAWTAWPQTPSPVMRNYAAFALDDTGHHGIFNGGLGQSDSWLLTIPVNPLWTSIPPIATPPPAVNRRYAAGGVFDPLRERFVMFGGAFDQNNSLNLLGDVNRLQIAADSGWVNVWSNAILRMAMGAVLDPIRDRIVVFGGYNGAFLNDVKMIDASTLLPSSATPFGAPPEKRDYFAAIYDPIRDRIVIYGGNDAGVALGDVWALNFSPSLSWALITPAAGPAPPPRMLHSAIYDPIGDRMLVFGGSNGSNSTFNDLWALSLGGTPTWTQLAPKRTPPSSRYGDTFQYDPNRQRALLFGGTSYLATPVNDLWELSLTGTLAWNQLSPGGVLPSPRYAHIGIYDPVFDRLLVSGGANGTVTHADIWRLQFSSGSPTATAIALLSSEAHSDEVTLKWGLSGDAATYARLERRDDASDWRTIESGPVSGSSVTYHDHAVMPGGRYAYRLIAVASGETSTSSETWMDVPAGPQLSLSGFSPNPATREARVVFSVASRASTTIDVVDVGGRRVASRRIDAPTPGAQSIAIAPSGGLSPGLYFVRLTQGNRTLVARGTVMK